MAELYVNSNNVSHLIFASCYVRDTYCLHHFSSRLFLNRKIREINMSRKFHVIRYIENG